jgi:hypothetical protein
MLRIWAHIYVNMGQHIHDTRELFQRDPLDEIDKKTLNFRLAWMFRACQEANLPVTKDLIEARRDDPPQNLREFNLLVDAMMLALAKRLLLYVPVHLAKYYDCGELVSDVAAGCFPKACAELRDAGTALAAGLDTACVFHAMRGAEMGLRVLAKDPGVEFPDKPRELADWHNLIDQSESKIRQIGQRPKTAERDENLRFYSFAASQFRYFKDGWRVRVSHARENYTESEARRVLDHTCDFFGTLAERLSE